MHIAYNSARCIRCQGGGLYPLPSSFLHPAPPSPFSLTVKLFRHAILLVNILKFEIIRRGHNPLCTPCLQMWTLNRPGPEPFRIYQIYFTQFGLRAPIHSHSSSKMICFARSRLLDEYYVPGSINWTWICPNVCIIFNFIAIYDVF